MVFYTRLPVENNSNVRKNTSVARNKLFTRCLPLQEISEDHPVWEALLSDADCVTKTVVLDLMIHHCHVKRVGGFLHAGTNTPAGASVRI